MSKIFSHRLKEILSDRNVKPINLSKATGIDKSSISSYLSGRYEPKTDKLVKIATELKVDPLWLMGMADKKEVE